MISVLQISPTFFSTNPNIFYFSRFFLKKAAPEPVEGF